MLFSAFYCTYIIIDDIKENQYGRISTYPRIASIAESVSEGYSLIWFQPILSKNDNFDESIREWRKSSLEAYLQYILKRAENVDFKVISEFADTYRYEKSIVLYPVENELNMDTKRDFEDNAELHGFILFEDVGGIKVYIN
jgi:hypothetical protein